jgi:hypothetical protein
MPETPGSSLRARGRRRSNPPPSSQERTLRPAHLAQWRSWPRCPTPQQPCLHLMRPCLTCRRWEMSLGRKLRQWPGSRRPSRHRPHHPGSKGGPEHRWPAAPGPAKPPRETPARERPQQAALHCRKAATAGRSACRRRPSRDPLFWPPWRKLDRALAQNPELEWCSGKDPPHWRRFARPLEARTPEAEAAEVRGRSGRRRWGRSWPMR